MSALRIEDHVRCRMVTPDGPLSITGEIIKIFPAGQSYWLHVRQDDGAVHSNSKQPDTFHVVQ